MNTDSFDKDGIKPQTDFFFFNSFGADGLKRFIIQDDQKVVEKILLGTEQLIKTDTMVTLVNIKFSLNACKYLSKNDLNNLRDAARDFFYFVQSFGDKLKLRDFVNLWVVEKRIQDLVSIVVFFIFLQQLV